MSKDFYYIKEGQQDIGQICTVFLPERKTQLEMKSQNDF